jgi:hypothetical protein
MIVELRQYLLQPGRREDLIELFDREFVETQEAVGMDVLGQFRDLDRPDHFVWLRRFDNMESRRESLAAFYGGPVWAQHSEAARATMIDTDDVLLLRPLSADVEFGVAGPAVRDRDAKSGAVAVLIQHRKPGREREFNAHFESNVRAQLESVGARSIGIYETEPAENTFPRLPVRDANVLVWFGAFDTVDRDASAWQALDQLCAWSSLDRVTRELSTLAPDILRLTPTSRSLLDGAVRSVGPRDITRPPVAYYRAR